MNQQSKGTTQPLITRSGAAAAFLGIPPSTFYALAKSDPTFPAKIRLGPQTTGYRTDELVAWIESKRERVQA